MPKLFEKQHSNFIERYFRTGAKKYIETNDFKTFAKDSNNFILQIKLGLKLLPILNYLDHNLHLVQLFYYLPN